jgi:hypothetical protein
MRAFRSKRSRPTRDVCASVQTSSFRARCARFASNARVSLQTRAFRTKCAHLTRMQRVRPETQAYPRRRARFIRSARTLVFAEPGTRSATRNRCATYAQPSSLREAAHAPIERLAPALRVRCASHAGGGRYEGRVETIRARLTRAGPQRARRQASTKRRAHESGERNPMS